MGWLFILDYLRTAVGHIEKKKRSTDTFLCLLPKDSSIERPVRVKSTRDHQQHYTVFVVDCALTGTLLLFVAPLLLVVLCTGRF